MRGRGRRLAPALHALHGRGRNALAFHNPGSKGNTEIAVTLSPTGAADLMEHIAYVHAFCWREGGRPIDAREGEQRPA